MVTGIIAEYNPFHNGHKYHIEKAKLLTSAKYVVVVLAGNFMQRGMPSNFDKFTRAKMAVLNGADLVVELPVQFSTASAEYFATAGVYLLEALGVKNICFGAEHDNLEDLQEVAKELNNETDEFKAKLKYYLKLGYNYPKSRELALGTDLLKKPNNILAVEYLRAIERLGAEINPVLVRRVVSGYHDLRIEAPIASATAVREALARGVDVRGNVPPSVYDLVNDGYVRIDGRNIMQLMKYKLLITAREDLLDILDVDEPLLNRLYKYGEVADISCKNYTMTRINRAMLHIILDIKKQDVDILPEYIRILAIKNGSKDIFKHLSPRLPVIKNTDKLLQKEKQTTEIYNILNSTKFNEYCNTMVCMV